jgi:hypothetical protein
MKNSHYWDKILDRSIEIARKVDNSNPLAIRLHIGVIYMGDQIGDVIVVEVKNKDGELGWLYTDSALMVYERDGTRYFARMSQVKALAEEQLAKKIFMNGDEEAVAGAMVRVGKAVFGYLDLNSIQQIAFIP